VHIALLFGSLWTVGLGPRFGPQPPGIVLFWALAMLVAMTFLALVWNRIQRVSPRLAVACRITTLALLVYPLL
jgi:hypothetical protein